VTSSSDVSPDVFTAEEQRDLTERLRELTRAIHAGELADRPLDLGLIRDLHGALFQDVRSHAGRHRRPGQGSERIVFGPHRSSHSRDVETELEAIFAKVRKRERALEDAEGAAFVETALSLAVWAHAEIVRIHPFEDGNGRVSRLCAGHLLVRHGLRPVAIEAVKQEYTEALNHYFVRGDLTPLVDLYLQLAPVGR
jgi:Fic family protein